VFFKPSDSILDRREGIAMNQVKHRRAEQLAGEVKRLRRLLEQGR
jgi:hypothetical protein